MINSELLIRDIKSIESSMDQMLDDGIHRMEWSVGFGTLLYMIRDKKHGIPFNSDFDISITGEYNYDRIHTSLINNGFKKERFIKNDISDDVYFASYVSPNKLHIDLFFWYFIGRNAWHTYDYYGNAKDGIPSPYHWKSVPAYMLEGTYKYNWMEDVSPLKVPALYGTLLDYWYPNWFVPDAEFGQSRAQYEKETMDCFALSETLLC